MKIYWTIKSVPEFSGMSKKQINEIWIPCYWKTYKHWQQWFMMSISILSIVAPVYLLATGSLLHVNTLSFILIIVVPALVWFLWGHYSIVLGLPYIRDSVSDKE